MAEILQSNSNGRGSKKGVSKVHSTRVDLTPMVDLGFLLITFFIFTTTMANPTAFKLALPDDTSVESPMVVSEERLITFILGKEDRVFYYEGQNMHLMTEISFEDMRETIIRKKQIVHQKFGSQALTVLIKCTQDSNYKNIVDALDEMTISAVSTYMLTDPQPNEVQAVAELLK